jgi:hypothetical protein
MNLHTYARKLEAVTLAARDAVKAYRNLRNVGDGNGHELAAAVARVERALVLAGYPAQAEKVEAR